jgi:hypothetical protein
MSRRQVLDKCRGCVTVTLVKNMGGLSRQDPTKHPSADAAGTPP